MKQIAKIILIGSILLNLFLLVERFVPFRRGGGVDARSPDGRFVATAMSFQSELPFASRQVFGEFKVMMQTSHSDIAVLRLHPTLQEHDMAYRGAARVVWSEDSTRVSFRVPEGEFTLNVEPYTRTPDAQDRCVRNMEELWEACRSYHLSANIASNERVEPEKLGAYFAQRVDNLRCPSGATVYAPFSYVTGPVCPNSKEHTTALRKRAADR